jgi:hypothetical protein
VKSFDPDDETPYVEVGDEPEFNSMTTWWRSTPTGRWRLLDLITGDLPGGGESREGQRQMVRSVAAAFTRRQHTVIEAGTGVGKSLAYLVPAVMTGQRVVIATATKNLQDQLATKDAPTVAAHALEGQGRGLKGKEQLPLSKSRQPGRRRRSDELRRRHRRAARRRQPDAPDPPVVQRDPDRRPRRIAVRD